MQIKWHAMVDGGDEIGTLYWATLAVGDRDQRHFAEAEIKRLQVRQVLPAVQRRYGTANKLPKQRKMVIVSVEVQDVEIVGTFADPVQHQHIIRNWITHFRVEPQRRCRTTDKPRRGHRVAAREQGDVMAEADEFFREIGNDTLRAAIEPRRYALNKWRNLCDFHGH